MEALLILVIVASLLAIGYAAFNFASVKRLDEGTDRMKEIASAIRVGANAFIEYEYKIIAVVVAVIAVIFMIIFTIQYKAFSWEPSVCFIIGVVMSALAARKMVEEVRRQFREIPGILEGKAKPDYKTCIEISSQGALKEMKVPSVLAILFPLVSGFLFGPMFVGGLLIGATLSAIMLAIFTGNAGGAWDNGKKYIESGAVKGQGKGSPAHDAAVVGDTVGDPLKDTVGPSLDILIKIMSTVSLVAAVLFYNYNLLYLIFGIR